MVMRTINLTNRFQKLSWWQIGLLAVAVSAIGGLSSLRSGKKERLLYNKKLKQAPWAPPAWLFAPAWTFNNIFTLLALQRIFNSELPEKNTLLALQAAIWAVYFSFGYIYFNKQSSVLAAVWTKANAGLALSSFLLAWRSDKKLASCYLPLLGWTSFASTLAGYQALNNPDPVLHTKALLNYIKK
jgi:translocator protein